ncbi:MAG: hypothetical protein IKK74_10790 [Clostridia bacterium]|nr:hypothetical protein [Clostridia bacterium]
MNTELYKQFLNAFNVLANAEKFQEFIDESKLRWQEAAEEEENAQNELEYIKYKRKDTLIRLGCVCFCAPALPFALIALIVKSNKYKNLIQSQKQKIEELSSKCDKVLAEEGEICKQIKADRAKYLSDNESLLAFIPQDYRNIHAVGFMTTAIKNCRADSLKEAINLYEEELYRLNMLEKAEQSNMLRCAETEYLDAMANELAGINQGIENIEFLKLIEYYNNLK